MTKAHWLTGLIILAVIAAVLCSGTIYAERYAGDPESIAAPGEIDISNHLREESWSRDGSFIRYEEDGFISRVGVDVSKWNGDIDWFALKEQGVEFAIIRVGFRGYENGEIVLDDRFYEYMDGALSAGLEVGVYFFSQAIDDDEAVEEAQFVLEHIAGYDMIQTPKVFSAASTATNW